MEISESIIDGCVEGNRRAQEALYRYAYSKLMAICARYGLAHDDAVSIFNDTMLKVFLNFTKYDKSQALLPWIKKILVYNLIDQFRKKNKNIEDSWPIFPSGEAWEASSLSFLPDRDLNATYLLQLISQLPPSTREVFNLFAIDGFSHKEISEMLKISIGTSKWHLNNARTQLQSKLSIEEAPSKKSRYA